jgi:hypothetical protein
MLFHLRGFRNLMTRLNAAANAGSVKPYLLFFPALLLLALSAGCGSNSAAAVDCSAATSLTVAPPGGSANHVSAPPGNKVQFVAANQFPATCTGASSSIRNDLTWTLSDTTNATIGNTLNVDYGIATCNNTAPGVITVTATGTNARSVAITGTATLLCQ